MPGAVNMPFTTVLDGGAFRPAHQLRDAFSAVATERPIVTSCGSGVTACVIALAALLADHDDVVVYDGSWSEWGAPDGGPVTWAGDDA